jgi:hypothetical protein
MTMKHGKRAAREAREIVPWLALVAVLVTACRTGGPHASRRADGGAPSDVEPAAIDTAAVLTGGNDGDGHAGDGRAGNGPPDGDIAEAGAPPPPDGVPPPPDGDSPPTDNGCVSPAANEGCDPVCNTGCPALSRCDVTDRPRTGRCIGIWISGEGDLCLKTDSTDPCAAHLTCVEGACRRLCYRDSDCAAPGTCCGQDLLLEGQASGYKICVACPR